MTWRHISPWSRVPLDRRLAPSIKIVIKGLGRGIPQPCSERLISGINRKSIMGYWMSPCSHKRTFVGAWEVQTRPSDGCEMDAVLLAV